MTKRTNIDSSITIRKLKRYKAPGTGQIPKELIQAWRIFHSEICKLTMLNWNKEELTHQWIVVSIHKKGDITECIKYQGISVLSTSYTLLAYILLSRQVQHADEIIGHYRCGFRRNRSTTDQIFYMRQILEKKWYSTPAIYRFQESL
jgi:hypothetical protein